MILQELRALADVAGWQESGGFADKRIDFLLLITLEGKPLRKPDGSLDCWFPLTTRPCGKNGIAALGKEYEGRPETLRRNQNYVDADCFVGRADRVVFGDGRDGPADKCRKKTEALATAWVGELPELKPVKRFYDELSASGSSLNNELRQALVGALLPFQPKVKVGKTPKRKLPDKQEVAICITTDDYRPIFNTPGIRGRWRSRFTNGSSTAIVNDCYCLCCGMACNPVQIHKRVIKGLPGPGSKGVPLLSYNKEPFQSHGFEDCFNAPMCDDCVDGYTIALNKLIGNKAPSVSGAPFSGSEKLAGLAFLFWFRQPSTSRPIDRVLHGVKHIEQRFSAVRTGLNQSVEARENRFFLLIMSAPTLGRAVVHDWIDESLSRIDLCLTNWFESTEIVNPYTGRAAGEVRMNEPAKGMKGMEWSEIMDRHIPSALGREIKDRDKIRKLGMRWNLQKDAVLAIFKRALLGRRLPLTIMHMALDRLREGIHDVKEKKHSSLPGFTTARLGLMRATLNDHPELLWKRRTIMPGLDRSRGDPAYVCGRLLAILSRIQAKAMSANSDAEKERRLSANVVSRYYGAASSRPATGLYLPLRMRIHHLNKLDRDDPWAAIGLRKELQETCSLVDIDTLPRTLSPAQQCVFAIGFEHQTAEFFRPRKPPIDGTAVSNEIKMLTGQSDNQTTERNA